MEPRQSSPESLSAPKVSPEASSSNLENSEAGAAPAEVGFDAQRNEQVERKLIGLLKNPSVSPFGMPVPGLELLGLPEATLQPCSPIAALEDGRYLLVRIGEPLQLDGALLSQLAELGLVPGREVDLTANQDGWLLVASGNSEGLLIDSDFAQHLFLGTSSGS